MAKATQSKKVAEDQLTPVELSELEAAFRLFDRQNDGYIDPKKLIEGMRALGRDNSTEAEVQDLISTVDNNGTGKVSLQDFTAMMSKKMRMPTTDKDLREAFEVYDADNKGLITVDDIATLFSSLGQSTSRQEIEDIVRTADLQNIDSINFDDFVSLYKEEPMKSETPPTTKPVPSSRSARRKISMQPFNKP